MHVDLSGMWAPTAQQSAPAGTFELRRLDDKHRLMLPITIRNGSASGSAGTSGTGAASPAGVRLQAQREHAVLTVFLPDASGAPAPGRLVAPLALAAGGRLTLGQVVCAELGLSAGSAVAIVLDPQRRTLSICAASRLADAVSAGVEAARRPPASRPRVNSASGHAEPAARTADATVVPLRRPG